VSNYRLQLYETATMPIDETVLKKTFLNFMMLTMNCNVMVLHKHLNVPHNGDSLGRRWT